MPVQADDHSVVGRALAIIEAVTECANVTLADLAKMTGIPKPTVLRIAGDLVRRGLLARRDDRCIGGPQLVRLGERALRQQRANRYRPVLKDLHGRHGGLVWLVTGDDVTDLQPTSFVCDRAMTVDAPSRWPRPGRASLINSAAGHVVLAHSPELLTRVVRSGMAPVTPFSARDGRQLLDSVRRTQELGVAAESEQIISGWTCAAARVPDIDSSFTVIGVAVPVDRSRSRVALRSMVRSLTAIAHDTSP